MAELAFPTKATKKRDTAAELERARERAIHHGAITVPYGPHKGTGEEGWHYPGGGFTTSSIAARMWAWELDQIYQELLTKKEAQHGAG